jgi:hypothetical protein
LNKSSLILTIMCAIAYSITAHSASTSLWENSNGTWYDRTTFYDGVNSLAGGIHYIDGNYVSDDHTVTSLWGNNTRTFTDTIISITDQPNITDFMVALAPAPIPIPAAAWLFGSGLVGLISIARRNKA